METVEKSARLRPPLTSGPMLGKLSPKERYTSHKGIDNSTGPKILAPGMWQKYSMKKPSWNNAVQNCQSILLKATWNIILNHAMVFFHNRIGVDRSCVWVGCPCSDLRRPVTRCQETHQYLPIAQWNRHEYAVTSHSSCCQIRGGTRYLESLRPYIIKYFHPLIIFKLISMILSSNPSFWLI